MKHLLILLSLLLLSSPVNGNNHEGETLYVLGEYPDWEWVESVEKGTQPKYQGQVKDGKPNGLGVIIYPDGIWKGGNKYVGEWKDGKEHGQGTLTTPVVDSRNLIHHGRKYVGEWKNGKHWNGTTEKDGKIEKKVVNGKYIRQ